MPYQIVPGLAIISVAFTLMGVGFGAVNKSQARSMQQVCVMPPLAPFLSA